LTHLAVNDRAVGLSVPKVLVVDDEQAIRDILADFLSMEGYQVHTAENGSVALQELERAHYDLILSDMKMPVMGGLELLERIQETRYDAAMVLMTGFGTVESAIHAMKRGALDYVLKPFKVEEVMHIVQRGIDQQRLRVENMQLKETLRHYQLAEALGGSIQLEELLAMICDLVFKETDSEAVSLVIQDPHNPSRFLLDRVRTQQASIIDPQELAPDANELLAAFLAQRQVMLSDEAASRFLTELKDPSAVSSFMSVPLRVRGTPIGMLSAYRFKRGARFNEGQRKALAMLASRAAQAVDSARLFSNLQNTFRETIQGLAFALEAKDEYTAGHSWRVTEYARVMTDNMKDLTPEQADVICQSGMMHDIGKIGIRSEDLNKPDKLTQKEYNMFKSHPGYGKRILEPITFLHDIIPGVYWHHEMWDGSGYPDNLKGDDIPVMARILSIADTYDAMCSNRAYRKALPHAIAVEELARCAGRQFDPYVIRVFLDNVDSLRQRWAREGKWVPE
jgi:response regulator RpfG family c-di-GMP phosphodiesterase